MKFACMRMNGNANIMWNLKGRIEIKNILYAHIHRDYINKLKVTYIDRVNEQEEESEYEDVSCELEGSSGYDWW